jgi:hypothetical protein
MRRAFLDLDQFRFGELFFLAHDFARNELALDRVRNKDGFALFSRDAFSAKSNIFDFQIDKTHLINTLLQLGVQCERNVSNRFSRFSGRRRKPLKRLGQDSVQPHRAEARC